jgi:hypothetical protein
MSTPSLNSNYIGSGTQVLPLLPPVDTMFQVPVLVLQQRVAHRGNCTVAQWLIQWSDMSASDATWEDLDELHC